MKHFINLKDIPAKDLRKIITDAKKRKNFRQKLNNLDKHPLYMKILQVQIYDACEKIKIAGRTIINSYSTGIENKLMKKCLVSMVPDFSINIKEIRRSIAMHLIENNGYSIS